jgi:hypothetical protein
MPFLVSAIATSLTQIDANEREERTSPLIMVAFSSQSHGQLASPDLYRLIGTFE